MNWYTQFTLVLSKTSIIIMLVFSRVSSVLMFWGFNYFQAKRARQDNSDNEKERCKYNQFEFLQYDFVTACFHCKYCVILQAAFR